MVGRNQEPNSRRTVTTDAREGIPHSHTGEEANGSGPRTPASHSTEAIAANENVTGTAIVRIGAGDAYFKSSGCQDWVKTG